MGRAGGEDGVWIARGLLQNANEDNAALLVLLTIHLDPHAVNFAARVVFIAP